MSRSQRKFLPLFWRIFLFNVLIGAVILAAMSWKDITSVRDTLRSNLKTQLDGYLENAAAYFERNYILDVKDDLRSIERSESLNNYLSSQRNEVLINKPAAERFFLNYTKKSKYLCLRYFDPRGVEQISTFGNFRNKNYLRLDHPDPDNKLYSRMVVLYERLRSLPPGTVLFQEPFQDKDKLTFLAGIAKQEPEVGGLGGIIMIRCDLSDFFGYLSKFSLYGENPVRVFGPDESLLFGKPLPEDSAGEEASRPGLDPRQTFYRVSREIKGDEYQPALIRIVLNMPGEVFASILDDNLRDIWFFLLGVILLISVLALLVSRQITRPLTQLALSAGKIAAGDFSARIALRAGGEVGALMASFNDMAQALEQTTVSRDDLLKEITLRKIIEGELQLQRDRVHQYLEIAGVIILVINKDGAVQLINRKGSEVLGIPQDDIIGKDWCECFVPKDERGRVRKVFEELIQARVSEENSYFENIIVNAAGERRTIAWYNKVLKDRDGAVYATLSSGEDITERKQAEAELKQAYDELRSAQAQLVQSAKMASIGVLAGGVAHEINNPLTGVLTNVQLVKMMAAEKSDFNIGEFREILDVIEECSLRCVNIIRSLLNFSRISSGVFHPVNVNEAIERILGLIEQEMTLQNIVIRRELAAGLPQIMSEEQLFQQIVLDIIANAKWAIKKKGAPGGAIVLKTAADPAGEMLVVTISDNGVGIPEKNLSRIFDPFFTTKPVGEGTGLGMSTVYRIVKDHGGTIIATSEEGAGATFTISIPFIKGQGVGHG